MKPDNFKSLAIKDYYRHSQDDLIKDFYIPVLSVSKYFYRAAGYFSSSIFNETILGISKLIQNGGHVRLVTSFNLTGDDTLALLKLNSEERDKYISKSIQDLIEASYESEEKRSVEIFCWLIANSKLELKIAFGDQKNNFLRLYHEKIGVFQSLSNEGIAFKGSLNESQSAYTLNFESIEVFKDWEDSDKKRFSRITQDFEDLWSDATQGLKILNLDSEVLSFIQEIALKSKINESSIGIELSLYEERFDKLLGQRKDEILKKEYNFETPEWFLSNIYEHQKNAYLKWKENNFNGFFEYATGSGKTLTSLYCSNLLFKEKGHLFILVLVPQVFIAEQWVREFHNFGIRAIKCYGSRQSWDARLRQSITSYNIGHQQIIAIVSVNATATSEYFQGLISKVSKNLLVIGDEAHNLGAKENLKALPDSKEFSIGLSATPKRFMDDDGTENVLKYFGGIVASFGLRDALELKILTPYYYHIIPVYLLPEEEEEFVLLTRQIRNIVTRSNGDESTLSENDNNRLKNLRLKRAKILSSTPAKIEAFRKEINLDKKKMKSIIYCGAGKDADDHSLIKKIIEVYQESGFSKISKFTSCETFEEREKVLQMLKDGDIEAIAAIKCLDEGVDLPVVEAAYFLSSGVNEKEFIQRRGRVMRKSPGKSFSYIYDFVVLPRIGVMEDYAAKSLFRREFARVEEFASLAVNKHQALEKLNSIKDYMEEGENYE